MSDNPPQEKLVDLRMRDGIKPHAVIWSMTADPRATLIVSHGMGEHSARYRDPLRPIIESGIDVYALDHRGHGLTAREPDFGDYGEGGFEGVVSDLVALVEKAKDDHPDKPLILFGHSMGSMIAQAFVIDHAELLDGLVLSGSIAVDHIPTGADPALLIPALNSPFAPARTDFDWLSRDEAEVDRYIDDHFCGFGLTDASFASLTEQGPRLADPASLAQIPNDLPIYIFSGDHDPLHLVLQGLKPLLERYESAGKSVQSKIYVNGRHEMLNETNRDEVVGDLKRWLEAIIN